MAGEPAFASGIRKRVHEPRTVFRADRPAERETLDPASPQKCLRYYYQVRSNITHRGKGVVRDFDRVSMSLGELLPTFREVLETSRKDAA